jgi:hypothetical protein
MWDQVFSIELKQKCILLFILHNLRGLKSKFIFNFPTCKWIIVNYGQFKSIDLIKYMMKIVILPFETK